MKYLLVPLLSLIIISPAYAAKQVNGTVPVLPPLQPPPADFKVDSTNFFNSPPEQQQAASQESQEEQAVQQEALKPTLGKNHQSATWLIISLAATVLIGYAAYKFFSRKKS